MKDDYEDLDRRVKKLQSQFDSGSASSRHIRARLRGFISTDEIREIERRLSGHIEMLHLALSIISE
jgi:hypothetical protein